MTELEVLFLRENEFTGQIPPELGAFAKSIGSLNLSGNWQSVALFPPSWEGLCQS